MTVRLEQDRHCLRGLKWNFVTEPSLPPARVVEAIEAEFGDRLVKGTEKWPTGTVTRLILQFRAEFRVGERPGEVSLIHRYSASDDRRERDRQQLFRLLARIIAEGE